MMAVEDSRPSYAPVPVSEEALAVTFDACLVPALWGPFSKHLVERLEGRLASNARILELGCASGQLTMALHRFAPEGRIVAIEPRRPLLDLARGRAGSLAGRRIFFKDEPVSRVSFADSAFDAVVSNVAFGLEPDRALVLAEMRRCVAPEGIVALTAELAGSWAVVLDVYEEVLERFEFSGAAERLADLRATYPPMESVIDEILWAGLRVLERGRFSVEMRFRNVRELFRDPIIASGPLRSWMEVAGSEADWQRAVFHLRQALDKYFVGAEQIEVVVEGCVILAAIAEEASGEA